MIINIKTIGFNEFKNLENGQLLSFINLVAIKIDSERVKILNSGINKTIRKLKPTQLVRVETFEMVN